MILRSITKHVKDQNWFAVGLDFFIVVFGVFVGLQVENWNEDRQNQNLANKNIKRLQTEIKLELAIWNKAVDYFETAHNYGIFALEEFDKPVQELDDQFLIAMYQASQVWFVAVNRSTFDELKTSGQFVNIRDEELRGVIANNYLRVSQTDFTLNQTSEYRRIARLNLHHTVQGQIRKHCGDLRVTKDNNFYYIKLPSSCDIEIPSKLLKAEIAKMHKNTEVQQELRFHLSVLEAQLGAIRATIVIAESTLLKLSESTK